jgi:type IV secretion system protein VirD4
MVQADRAFKANKAALNYYLGGGDPYSEAATEAHEAAQSWRQKKAGRDLLDPAEILRLKEQLLVIAPGSGVHPVLADKLPPYWLHPAMVGRFAPDPLFPPMDRVTIRHHFWGKRTRKFITQPVPDKLAHWPNHQNGTVSYVQGYKTF